MALVLCTHLEACTWMHGYQNQYAPVFYKLGWKWGGTLYNVQTEKNRHFAYKFSLSMQKRSGTEYFRVSLALGITIVCCYVLPLKFPLLICRLAIFMGYPLGIWNPCPNCSLERIKNLVNIIFINPLCTNGFNLLVWCNILGWFIRLWRWHML